MIPVLRSLLLHRTSIHSFRSRYPTTLTYLGSTYKRTTSTIGENKSGFINLEKNEGLLFLTSLYTSRRKDTVYARQKELRKSSNLEALVKKHCVPSSFEATTDETNATNTIPISIEVVKIIPRVRDGGVFVKYRSEETNVRKVHSGVKTYLKHNPVRFLRLPFVLPIKFYSYGPITLLDRYIFKPVTVHPVLGKPLIEDMDRFPSTALKVEFVDPVKQGHPEKWDQEKIFSVFREYGKIADIIPQYAPGEDSDMPKSVVVWYRKIRSATAAKNCLQGYETDYKGNTESLRVLYRKRLKVRLILVWLSNHPNVSVPVLALLVASLIVWLFDPVRVWFIEAKITECYTSQLAATFKQLWRFVRRKVHGYAILVWPRDEVDHKDENTNRRNSETYERKTTKLDSRPSNGSETEVESLQRLLKTDKTTVVYHGSHPGKLELVRQHVLKGRKHVLVIDCKPIAEASTGSAAAKILAKQVRYRPLFSFFSQVYGLLLEATIKSNDEATSAAEKTLDEILRATRVAVKNVALRKKDPKSLQSDEEFLQKSSSRPVVIFDNFSHTDPEDDRLIYQKLVNCAYQLMSEKHANVFILTNDDDFYKSLPYTLYDRMMLDGPMTSGLTSGCENAVKHLQRAKMISVEGEGGIVMRSRNGEEAFTVFTSDKNLVTRMALQTHIAKCELKNENIKRWEEELARFGGMAPHQELSERREYLLKKISDAHGMIKGYEEKMKNLREILSENSAAES
ncbi:hypothetical protein K440DRAFT_660740 [Wilcoxina mikolae CBS 423.85]|nr:hypothetical protein K440DRAFT_660740 [Wilcoxina mikolae CBS 423.85]